LNSLIKYFKIFYKQIGAKLFLFAFLVLSNTIIESLGFTLALPIIEYGSDPDEISKYSYFIYNFLESINIEVSIISLVVLVIFLFTLRAIVKFTQEAINVNILYKYLHDLRIDLIERYRKMNYSYYINTEIGYFNNIITTEIGTTIAALNKYVVIFARSIAVGVYLSFAFVFSWEISIATVCAIILFYFLFKPITHKIKVLSTKLVEANALLQNAFIQFILNFKYLKSTNKFLYPVKNIIHAVKIQREKAYESALLQKATLVGLELIAMILFSLSILFLVLVRDQQMSSIMVTILFIYRALLRLPEIQTALQGFMAQSASVDIVNDSMDQLTDHTEIFEGRLIRKFSSGIEICNIDFSFGKKRIISNINITIPFQSSIGIVGESGSGKTTLVDIITGLLNPQAGKIHIDSIDYDLLNKESLRNLFGYITQDPIIFNDTIFNNVSLWSGDADDKECFKRVKKSCEIANCLDFIADTENGFNTIVGDRGVKLSGGQKQRISIAREMYSDPKIFIFDEATSSLDSKSENFIQNSINNLIGEKTMIIIAHRLSTVKKCNYIYLLEKGRIIQEGTWDKMISDKNSIFSKMCQLQGINN